MVDMGLKVQVDYFGAGATGDNRHAASIVRGLGIEYEWSESRPFAEACVFHGCSNIPSRLPAYVKRIS